MTFLFLIRHGETPWTKEKRFQGRSDTRLTLHGRHQAAAVARCLKRCGIDKLYSSDLWRARQTAAVISKAIRKKPVFDKRLRELNFGEWEGRTGAELFREKGSRYRDWCRGKLVAPKKGEGIPSLRKRIRVFLKKILRRHPHQKIAIVTHGGPVKIFLYEALKLPFRSLWSFRVDTASITVIGFDRDFAQVYGVNDTAHLPRRLVSRPEFLAS